MGCLFWRSQFCSVWRPDQIPTKSRRYPFIRVRCPSDKEHWNTFKIPDKVLNTPLLFSGHPKSIDTNIQSVCRTDSCGVAFELVVILLWRTPVKHMGPIADVLYTSKKI